MWSLTLRDLRFRRRRLIIAIAGTALVFGMALIMSGMSAGFRVEADTTLDAIAADAWIVPDGIAGPFTGFRTMGRDVLEQVAAAPGVLAADPLVIVNGTILDGRKLQDVHVIGARPGGIGDAVVRDGRRAGAPGEAVADRKAGYDIGESFSMQGQRFTVVGLVDGITYMGGVPAIFVPFADAQTFAFDGADVATTIVTRGRPTALAGFRILSREQVRDDILRLVLNGVQAIDAVRVLLWIVAATIIGAVVYLSALERVRDFAVLKAVGSSSAKLFASLVLQSVIVALVAAVFATGIALVLGPTFALPIVIPASAFALLPAVALAVGVLASLTGLKRSIDVDPALAFGSA